MGRMAKCRYCQANLNSKLAYCKITGKTKAFFCNEEHYNLLIEEKEQSRVEKEIERQKKQEEKVAAVELYQKNKDHAYYLICEIIGKKEIINTVLWKEWKEWNKVATNEQIGKYLEDNKSYLIRVISRLEDVEFLRIRYLSAILKNKLGDYQPTVKETVKPKVQVEETFYDTTLCTRNRRRSLADLEDEF